MLRVLLPLASLALAAAECKTGAELDDLYDTLSNAANKEVFAGRNNNICETVSGTCQCTPDLYARCLALAANVAGAECNLPGVAQPTAPQHNFCLRVKSEHKQLKCTQEKHCDQYHCFTNNPFADGLADGDAGTVSGTLSSRAYFEGPVTLSEGAITAEVTMLTIEGTTYTGKFKYSFDNDVSKSNFGLSLLEGSVLRKDECSMSTTGDCDQWDMEAPATYGAAGVVSDPADMGHWAWQGEKGANRGHFSSGTGKATGDMWLCGVDGGEYPRVKNAYIWNWGDGECTNNNKPLEPLNAQGACYSGIGGEEGFEYLGVYFTEFTGMDMITQQQISNGYTIKKVYKDLVTKKWLMRELFLAASMGKSMTPQANGDGDLVSKVWHTNYPAIGPFSAAGGHASWAACSKHRLPTPAPEAKAEPAAEEEDKKEGTGTAGGRPLLIPILVLSALTMTMVMYIGATLRKNGNGGSERPTTQLVPASKV